MKKVCFNVVAACALAGLAGCMTQSNKIPGMGGVPLAELQTTATYDVIGDATGTSTGGKLFGIFRVGGEDKVGQLGGTLILSPVEAAAIYNAIESVPTADALIAPRWSKKIENYVIYSHETVTVKGKAIRYNVSAR